LCVVCSLSGGGGNCVWCVHSPESTKHLFLHCDIAHLVWYEIFKWLGVVIIMPPNLMILLDCFVGAANKKRARKGFLLVWHSVVWVLWNVRNNLIFNSVVKNYIDIVEDVKVLSWKWSVDRLKVTPSLYYEWCWDPGDCFLR
jgi:hypothetical protein